MVSPPPCSRAGSSGSSTTTPSWTAVCPGGPGTPRSTAMESAYESAGIVRFAAWAHESDEELSAALLARGYSLEESTRVMGMSLDELDRSRPAIELGPPTWSVYLGLLGLPDLLPHADPTDYHVLVAAPGWRERRHRDGVRPRGRLWDLQRRNRRGSPTARARDRNHAHPPARRGGAGLHDWRASSRLRSRSGSTPAWASATSAGSSNTSRAPARDADLEPKSRIRTLDPFTTDAQVGRHRPWIVRGARARRWGRRHGG